MLHHIQPLLKGFLPQQLRAGASWMLLIATKGAWLPSSHLQLLSELKSLLIGDPLGGKHPHYLNHCQFRFLNFLHNCSRHYTLVFGLL